MSCSTCRDEFAGYKINGEVICKSCSATVACSECKTDLYSVITSYEQGSVLSNKITEEKPFPQHSVDTFGKMRTYSQLFDARSTRKHVKYYYQPLKKSFSSKVRSRVLCKSCVKNQALKQVETLIKGGTVQTKSDAKLGKCKISTGFGYIEDRQVFENIISYLPLPEYVPILSAVNSTWRDFFNNCTNWNFFTHLTFNERKIPPMGIKHTSVEHKNRRDAKEEWNFTDHRLYQMMKYFTKFSGFQGFPNLKHIHFPSKFQNITDYGLVFLISMCDPSKLESVDISACRDITWLGLTYLLERTRLKSLTLGGSKQMTTFFKFLDDFSKISNFSNLSGLHMYDGGKIPLSILEGLFKCSNLKTLSIVNSTLYYRSESTLMLPTLEKVVELNMMNTTIPLRSSLVEILPNFPNVQRLHLSYRQRVSFAAKVNMFAKCGHEFVNDIMEHLQYNLFAPDQLIVKKGDVGKEMYFISKGTVLVVGDSGEIYARLSKGDFFGEIALLFDTPRTASIRVSDDECEIYVLNKSDLFRVMRVHPHSSAIIKGEAQSRLNALESKNVKVVKKKKSTKKKTDNKKPEKKKEDVPIMIDKHDLLKAISSYKNLQALYIEGIGYDLPRLMSEIIPSLSDLEILDLNHSSQTVGSLPLPISGNTFNDKLKALFISLHASEFSLAHDESLVGIANSFPSLEHFATDDEFTNSQVSNFLKYYPNLNTISMPSLKKGAKAILDHMKLNKHLTYLNVHSAIFPEQLISFCQKFFQQQKEHYPLQSLILPESAWNTKQTKELLHALPHLRYLLIKNSISDPVKVDVLLSKFPHVFVNVQTLRQISARQGSRKRASLKSSTKLTKTRSKKNLFQKPTFTKSKHTATASRLSLPKSVKRSRSINQRLSSLGNLSTEKITESKSRDSSPVSVVPGLNLPRTIEGMLEMDQLSSSRVDKLLQDKEAEIKKLQEQHRNVLDRLHADYSNQINDQLEQIKALRSNHSVEVESIKMKYEKKFSRSTSIENTITCSGAGEMTVTILGARSLGGKDLLSKADPYARSYISNEQGEKSTTSQKTKTISKTQNPQWNETFKFQVKESATDLLTIEIYDADTFSKDDLLGVARIALNKVVIGKEQVLAIDIENPTPNKKSGKSFGTLDIIMKSSDFGIDSKVLTEAESKAESSEKLEDENESLKANIATLEEKLTSANEEVKSLSEKRNKAEENFVNMKRTVEDLKVQVENLIAEKEAMKNQSDDAQKQLEESQNKYQQEIKMVRSESQKELLSMVSEAKTLKEEQDKLISNVESKSSEVDSWKQKHDKLNDDFQSQINGLQDALNEEKSKGERLENQLKDDSDAHESNMADYKEELNKLKAELEHFVEKYDALQESHDLLKEENQNLKATSEEPKQPLQLTISSPEEAKTEIVEVETVEKQNPESDQERDPERTENKEESLQQRISELESQLASQQAATNEDNDTILKRLEAQLLTSQDQNVSLTNKFLKIREEHRDKVEKLKKLVSSLSEAVKSLKTERDELQRAEFNRKLENGELDSARPVDEKVANGMSTWTTESQPDYKKKLSSTREYLDEHREENAINWQERFEDLEHDHSQLEKNYERLQDRYEFQAAQMLDITKQLESTTTIIGMPTNLASNHDENEDEKKPTSPSKMASKSSKLISKLERVQYQNHLMRNDLIQADQHLATSEEAWARERVRYEERIATLRNNLRFASGLQSSPTSKRSKSTVPPPVQSTTTPRHPAQQQHMTIFDPKSSKKKSSTIIPSNSMKPSNHSTVIDVLAPILEKQKKKKSTANVNSSPRPPQSNDESEDHSMPDIHQQAPSERILSPIKASSSKRSKSKKKKKSKKKRSARRSTNNGKSKSSQFAFKARSPYEYFQGEELLLELYSRASASPTKTQ